MANYDNIHQGIFIERPNRFVAHVNINGQIQIAHVKNTGRCKELLVPGATVYLQYCSNPNRKTQWDLIAVQKNNRLINMDSQIPNQVVAEYIIQGKLLPNLQLLKKEQTYGNSRFDIYAEYQVNPEDTNTTYDKAYIEVKGVTLEQDGIAMFPDAPTSRGEKHIRELIKAHQEGYKTYIVFLIQMDNISHFTPNTIRDPQLAQALKDAKESGVNIIALTSTVTPDSITALDTVPVILD